MIWGLSARGGWHDCEVYPDRHGQFSKLFVQYTIEILEHLIVWVGNIWGDSSSMSGWGGWCGWWVFSLHWCWCGLFEFFFGWLAGCGVCHWFVDLWVAEIQCGGFGSWLNCFDLGGMSLGNCVLCAANELICSYLYVN